MQDTTGPADRQLAHINVARFRLPRGHAANAGFLGELDRVNAAAEAGDGLRWRFVAAEAAAADRPFVEDPHLLVNLSVWTDIEALRSFTYRDPQHRAMMRRRREWFERLDLSLALWWVPQGTRPTLRDGMARLDRLARLGPTAEAFSFARPFDRAGFAATAAGRDAA